MLCARDMHIYEKCALCLGSACIYDRFLISVERGVERGFMPGIERVVDQAGDVDFRTS